jgi:hypothetical protein
MSLHEQLILGVAAGLTVYALLRLAPSISRFIGRNRSRDLDLFSHQIPGAASVRLGFSPNHAARPNPEPHVFPRAWYSRRVAGARHLPVAMTSLKRRALP